ncbi:MAG: phosphate acyltransferase PlsX [Alkalibacterium sp.]|uniref:Phosphate acyltransferase n=1 Tax=Alkalibacterium gilvum TaxID=1130080 RepID=A0A1H6R7V1_9LACT|nr:MULTISPECIES: phosphate acyltransferase PlsX [Alkalibacterium]MDN6294274.1 phosphate acyltransferase PlsX [Alkalibacterium sp.]MDN6295982.1 phosphate acyltransferase PlsX [Alkalibacterium sp.]MDN6326559.1 phosphate acyltransferase PlsX [Alkalibacterium sp.]MDN6728861.1 phosphate acyltransferase PlsX [Alkalibacterium sp.]SEI47850.1 phosphate:acyl-[acyl carrier protein] acyltransferase [Alkalibacterium gilvum]
MRIAVDAMGGDNAPSEIVKGCIKAAKEFSDITLILYGKESLIRKELTEEIGNIEIVHTDEKILSEDDPVRSIRRKKEASMVKAALSVKKGENDALFSAGNTGALLAAGTLLIGRMKGVDRPGLLATFPSLADEESVFHMIDVGANADSKPLNINQYATLGTLYSKRVHGKEKPTVGLLNNGTEDNKGSMLTKEAYQLLEKNTEIEFIGNIEARELLNGVADVIVTDGFTGNAVLKTIEGTAISMMNILKDSIYNNGMKAKVGGLLLKDSLKNVKDLLDYSKHGGAVLFGVKAPVIKTHGSATQEPVYHTIRQTRDMLSSHVLEELIEYFEQSND